MAPLVGSAPAGRAQTPATRPNILFIMADDLGYADLSCYGARDYTTPCLDALAAQGLMLTQAYSNSAVCSATRVALITGRYQYRLDVGLDEPLGQRQVGLPNGHPTLPSLLKRLGYRTSLIGKWHLGDPPFGPLRNGYDRFFGLYGAGADYFTHTGFTQGGLIDNDKPVKREGYLTDLFGARAVEEIESQPAEGPPFFMSLHFTAPHWPWEGPQDKAVSKSLKSLIHTDGGSLAVYAEMVKSLDTNVGRVLDALDARGLKDSTIVIFTSDNGGERFSDVWPFTGMKTELLEGGIRIPALVRWPGRIRSASKSDQVMATMDWLPSLLRACGGAPDPDYPPDGEDLLSVLTGEARSRSRKLYWRYKAATQAALRDRDWKYLKLGSEEYLFDLATDLHERANLKDKEPKVFARLKQDWLAWNATMLPYREDTLSFGMKGLTPDRY